MLKNQVTIAEVIEFLNLPTFPGARILTDEKPVLEFKVAFENFKKSAAIICDKNFEIDKENIEVIRMLMMYFCNDPAFEQVKQNDYLKTEPSLKKGLALCGNSGAGKSILMEVFSHMRIPGNTFDMVYCDEIMNRYKKNGDDGLQIYYKEYFDAARTKPKEFCLDELGYERKFKDYGQQMPFMLDIILKRNRSWVSYGIRTHLTSNCSLNDIEQLYDYRTRGRIEQMSNVIYLGEKAESKDRRRS